MNKTVYQEIAKLKDLTEKKGKKVILQGKIIALFLLNKNVYAIQNTCPHQQGDLADGRIKDGKIYCPLHQWSFDLVSGRYSLDNESALKTYPVIIRNDSVFIKIE
jgi:NAD(P)H-dependent nitrite reductase small subunit